MARGDYRVINGRAYITCANSCMLGHKIVEQIHELFFHYYIISSRISSRGDKHDNRRVGGGGGARGGKGCAH